MYLDKVRARLAELPIISTHAFRPCTMQEVHTLERRIGRTLPAAYKEFLFWMGHDTGRLLAGSHFACPDLLDIQNAARALLQENEFPHNLPKDAFVFLMHQGYQFLFLRTEEGDDPPVYRYSEGETETSFLLSHQHFSDFLLAVVNDSARIRQQIAQSIAEEARRNPARAKKRAEESRRIGDYDGEI